MTRKRKSRTDHAADTLSLRPFDFSSLVDLPRHPSEQPDPTAEARWYQRISYLVPDLPALESASPDGRLFALVRDGEIVVRRAREDSTRALTQGTGIDCSWEVDGQGNDPWAPDGTRLFALHFDRRQVLRVPRVLYRGALPSIDWPHQTKAGAALGTARPFIVPLDGSSPLALEAGDTQNCYLRFYGWSPDGKTAWFGRYARDMSRVDVFAADGTSGTTRQVLREASPTFLCDVSRIIWGGPTGFTLLPDGGFLWCAERDGWNRLYRYDGNGKPLGALTPHEMIVHEVVRVMHRSNLVCFTASVEGRRPYDVHLFRASLDGGSCERLTEGDGVHEVTFESDATFVDCWSSPTKPPRIERRQTHGGGCELLGEAQISRLRASGWRAPQEFVVTAADAETPLHGLLFYPHYFDPKQSCPLIEMVYGGPQMTATPRRFMPRLGTLEPLLTALAHDGFTVAVLDSRGTPGRSKAFQDAAHRDFADHVVADHVAALRQLLNQYPWIDPGRIGVMGRSWGGYFALRFLLDAPDLYRAGISIVPGFDAYGGMLYEPYLGLPQFDDSPYRAADLFARAHTLKRPFQLMSGTLDTSTLGDAYRMSMLLTEAGVNHSNVVFPEQDHVFTGRAAALHDDMIRRFFKRELC